MAYKNLFLSLSFLFLSASASEQPTPPNTQSRKPFEWMDLANSTALSRNLRTYAAFPAALVSGFHYIAHADYIGAGRRCLKPGLLTGGLLASGIIFFSPEFKAIRAEKKYQKIRRDIEEKSHLIKTNPQKIEVHLLIHSETIRSVRKSVKNIEKFRNDRNPLTDNLIRTPRAQEFYTRCEQLNKELKGAKSNIKRIVSNLSMNE